MRTAPAVVAGAAAALVLALSGCGGGQRSVGAAPSSPGPAPTRPPSTSASSPAASSPAPGATPGPQAWPGYHGDDARTGAVATGPALSPVRTAWSDDLGAAVRGQAVVADGRVVAATERNRVVALDPATGALLWSHVLGTPLTDVDDVAGCGDIDPLGITSTPVVDTATGTVYVVGEVSDGGGRVHHQLQGLDVATGAVRLSEDVDPPLPPGERAVNLLQRASLALSGGRVYVAYGGNSGDCGHYHGWVVGVAAQPSAAPLPEVSFEVAADGEGGAVWQSGGAPAVAADGNLYVTTGNANPDPPRGGPDPKAYTESVVELTPDLRPVASFKDRVAGGDEDLSTSNPVLLPDGTLFATGKTDIGYLLRQGSLHQVAAVHGLCGSDPDGGPAYDAATDRLFVPCRGGGLQVVDLRRRALGPKLAGADSAPVDVGGHVWAVDSTTGVLEEYDAATGRRQQVVPVAGQLPVFTSPSVGAGVLLVGTQRGVTAFR